MATDDIQRLIISLEARDKQFYNALNKLNGTANRQARAIETRFAQMNARIGNSLAGVGKRWIAGLAAGVSVGALAKFSDAATRIDNALKVAGLSGDELEKVYGRLRDSAVKNAAPLESLVELYGRAAMVQKELGISGEELLGFTDKIALALRVSGKSAQESSGALLQLSQALGSGTVRAEEFNSILEGALPVAQAAAAGLKEAGGSVAKLRQLVVDGKVSSQAFFRAFEAGSVILEQKVQGATLTLAQATGNLETALIDTVREFNNATGASEKFAEGINNAAQAISDFDVSGFIQKISEAGGALEKFLNDVGNSSVFERLSEFLTGQEITIGQPIDLETAEAESKLDALEREIATLKAAIENNKEMAIDTTEASARLADLQRQANDLRATLAGVNSLVGSNYVPGTPGDPNALAQKDTLGPPVVKQPVSIKTYPASGSKKKGGKPKQSEYQREVEQIKERTAALEAERAAMESVNPLVEDYGFAIEKARAKHELLAAAQKAGLAITPELEAQIDALAEAYATAGAEAERLAEKQDKAREAAEDFKALGKDVLGGFIKDLRDGKSASEALANALNKVADKLLDIALNALFEGGGGSFGGIFGSIFKLFGFRDGGEVGRDGRVIKLAGGGRVRGPGGPRGDKIPAMLSDGEHVTRAAMSKKYGPLLDAINADKVGRFANGSSPLYNVRGPQPVTGGGEMRITVGVSADNNGNLLPFVESVSQSNIRKAAPTLVKTSVQQSQKATRANMPGFLAETQMRTM